MGYGKREAGMLVAACMGQEQAIVLVGRGETAERARGCQKEKNHARISGGL